MSQNEEADAVPGMRDAHRFHISPQESRNPSRQSSIMEETAAEIEPTTTTADAAGNGGAVLTKRQSSVTLAPEVIEAEEQKEQRTVQHPKKLNTKRPSFSSLTPRPLKHYLTREVLPHVDHYRNRLSFSKGKGPDRARPTLDELLDEKTIQRNERYDTQKSLDGAERGGGGSDDPNKGIIKFGWFDGVYMRCLLNIWGVMLFLRLTWVIGQAGLLEGLAVITLSNIVTTITAISMSAVSTNGQIKAGGIYYMISRSLGPEFGGAIGLMFTLANSIAVSMYIIGFCEALIDMLAQFLPDFNGIVDSTQRVNDVRLIGSVSLVLILGLAIVGMEWVTRVQMGLLVLLLFAQVDFIIGSFLPPSDDARAKGFVGYNGTVFEDNLWSNYEPDPKSGKENGFFSVFAVFFPAVTGIVAGANLSGDLKDPGVAIPKGTLLAIATTYISYVIYAIMVAGCTLTHASGIEAEVHFGTDLFNDTVGELLNITQAFDDCSNRDCDYGSTVSQQMMEVISIWGPLIYAGCFAATLSSAIASLVGAPRVFQAVAKDKLFPGIGSFAEGWGANNDPIRGYILVFVIALVCILVGDLNIVSSLLSNFFVAAYALINFSVFHASITNSPGWRPSFKYYNKWLALLGTILCIVVMFLMDYMMALVTFICIISLYMYVKLRNPDVNWGSSTQSQSFTSALKAVQTLARVDDHVKNFRPKLIVMSGNPEIRPCLLDFANLLTKRLSLLECADITDISKDWKKMAAMKKNANNWLKENNIKAFYAVTRNAKFSEGVRVAIELAGLGKLSPNMMLLGFNQKWKDNLEDAEEYFKAIQLGHDLHLAVGVLRVQGGLDVSELFGKNNERASKAITRQRKLSEMSDSSLTMDDRCESNMSVDSGVDEQVRGSSPSGGNGDAGQHSKLKEESSILGKFKSKKQLSAAVSSPLFDKDGNSIDDETIERIIQFRNKANKVGTVDVYWLYDDGGLTLLLPHILSTRAKFAKCKLRVFFLSDKVDDLDVETKNMAQLLAKFRIEFQDVILIQDVTKKPSKQTRDDFKELLAVGEPASSSKNDTSRDGNNSSEGDEDEDEDVISIEVKAKVSVNSNASEAISSSSPELIVSEETLSRLNERTNFHLRIAEVVRQNSSNAELIVMTLPLPKKGVVPPSLYMAWLDFTTKNMPPFLLVRGNQESVLTFYS